MESLPISKTISVKDAGFNEYWLQEQIWENPGCLELGDLESISKEKQTSSGGKLDILLKNPVDDSMYEVEVMLGETDASHIIRTIEYWDLIKKKWPQRQHFAVLVAEKITKRFFNVIQLMSNSIPIVAIQANIIDIEGKRSLHFTKILDSYEEPEDDLTVSTEIYDRKYWEKKSIYVLEIAERILEITSEIYDSASLVFGKSRISIACGGYNQMALFSRVGSKALIQFRFGDNKEAIQTLLDDASIPYTEQRSHFKITIGKSDLEEKQETFQKIAELNKRWWE
jgi:hypothetical protein